MKKVIISSILALTMNGFCTAQAAGDACREVVGDIYSMTNTVEYKSDLARLVKVGRNGSYQAIETQVVKEKGEASQVALNYLIEDKGCNNLSLILLKSVATSFCLAVNQKLDFSNPAKASDEAYLTEFTKYFQETMGAKYNCAVHLYNKK